LLVPEQNGGDLNDMLRVVRYKNDAVPAYTFPIPPLPALAFKRDDISAKGISFKLVNGPSNPSLDMTRKTCELTFCRIGKFSVPVHV
jgi:hypothetical protein